LAIASKPRLLDLFCGAGGAAMGYHRAGFEVVGVDIKPQKHYPFEFHQADAMTYPLDGFHVIHASPPCQKYTKASKQWRINGKGYFDLIQPIRERLSASGVSYVIENVPGAPLIEPTMLNGAMFGMKVLRRRYFETSPQLDFILVPSDPAATFKMGRMVKDGDMITPVGHFTNVAYAKKIMGVDWMNRDELSQAIPPAYTEFIGKQLLGCRIIGHPERSIVRNLD
jgi:DNA (cytosine-5)-methyltransferase 1